jgi:hypothetical protein
MIGDKNVNGKTPALTHNLRNENARTCVKASHLELVVTKTIADGYKVPIELGLKMSFCEQKPSRSGSCLALQFPTDLFAKYVQNWLT